MLTTQHLSLSVKVGSSFTNQLRPLSRYSSLADQKAGCFSVLFNYFAYKCTERKKENVGFAVTEKFQEKNGLVYVDKVSFNEKYALKNLVLLKKITSLFLLK
jgi:hypothetical protein